MKSEALSLEERAQLFRNRLAQVMTYEESLKNYNITPTQYVVSIRKRIDDLIEFSSDAKVIDDARFFDENRKKREGVDRSNQYCRLFDMSSESVKELYDSRKKGASFPPGFLISVHNCEEIFQLMIEERMPSFRFENRDTQVKMINSLLKEKNKTKKEFFHNNALKSVLENGPLGKKSFGGMILHLDKMFQNVRNQPSWFDLSEQKHCHPWNLSEKNQWNDKERAYIAFKHIIEEKIPEISFAQRNEQISIIEEKILKYKPAHISDVRFNGAHQWFLDNELGGLLLSKTYKGNVTSVFRDFDAKYSAQRNQSPLFDSSQKQVLPWWKYSKDWMGNENSAYDVLKTTLERIEGFKGASRSEQLSLIREKVCKYYSKEKVGAMGWFRDNGLEPFVLSTYFKPQGIVETLKWFDKLYSKERKQTDWFSESEESHLTSKSNRFKRTQLVVVGYD